MISVWEAHTKLGTNRRVFKTCPHAEKYFMELYKKFDGAELHRFEVTEEEFSEMHFED